MQGEKELRNGELQAPGELLPRYPSRCSRNQTDLAPLKDNLYYAAGFRNHPLISKSSDIVEIGKTTGQTTITEDTND